MPLAGCRSLVQRFRQRIASPEDEDGARGTSCRRLSFSCARVLGALARAGVSEYRFFNDTIVRCLLAANRRNVERLPGELVQIECPDVTADNGIWLGMRRRSVLKVGHSMQRLVCADGA
eukprot:scaffold1861_cov111-Isochrysis_galbana.AAC.7